jgi:hypothetical protein
MTPDPDQVRAGAISARDMGIMTDERISVSGRQAGTRGPLRDCRVHPKPGKGQQLVAAVKKHLHVLHAEQLVTDNPVT